jgi:ABC-type multidrug transport system permease subunit
MRNILAIGHNELRLFLKNRAAYLWLFVIPLAFIAGMSFLYKGNSKGGNRFPPVLIDNADTGFLGERLVSELSAQRLWRLDPAKDSKHKPVRVIRIPADFSDRVLARKSANVELLPGAATDAEGDGLIVEVRLVRALVALNSNLFETTASGAGWTPTEASFKAAQERPRLVSVDAKYADPRQVPTGINFSLPGNLVSFLMMNLLIFGGATMAATRRCGVLRRLLSLPVRRGELVAGQIYGLWLLGAVQIVFFLLVGKVAFQLNLGANLPGVLLVLLVFAWVAAALGVLVGLLFASPDRVVGVCVLTSLLMAALGGCWFPLEIAPDAMKLAAHCVPAGWALDGLHRLITFGGGFGTIVKPVTVLVAFGAAATVAAAKWFRA